MALATVVSANMQNNRVSVLPILMQEKKIKDVSWGSDKTLRIGVLDNGNNRSGFAGYVCLILAENGLSKNETYVKIIDIRKVISSGEFIKLGEAFCK